MRELNAKAQRCKKRIKRKDAKRELNAKTQRHKEGIKRKGAKTQRKIFAFY